MSGFVMGFYKMLKPFLPTRTNDKVNLRFYYS